MKNNNKATLIGISRLRMNTDGHGITTLVAFHGCPLRCRYCLNPQCLDPTSRILRLSPDEVTDILRKDELYFLATKGGVTFGGGEPLLNAVFIKEVLHLGAGKWHTTVETSLNVPLSNMEIVLPYIDEYIVDIKDTNPTIYKDYTGKSNKDVIRNLRWLVEHGKKDNIICRIPLIPQYNTNEDQKLSIDYLKNLGISKFDIFDYVTHSK